MVSENVRGRWIHLVFAVLPLLGIGDANAQAAPRVDKAPVRVHWEVKNRFPLFKSGTALVETLKLTPGMTLLDWSQQVLASNPDLLATFIADYRYSEKGGCSSKPSQSELTTLWDPCAERYAPELFKQAKSHRISMHLQPAPSGRCLFRLGEEARLA